ncbi:MAG: hypothetical protein WBH31_09155 [Promethearchaeia archaeon]
MGDEWDEYEKDEDTNPEKEKDLDELEEGYDPFSLKSKVMENEEEQEYDPFSLHRDECDTETTEDYDPFSLTEGDSANEMDEDYDPFSLHRDEVSEEQTGEEDITQKEEREEICENIDSQSTLLVQRESNKDGETCDERAEENSEQEKNQTEDTEEIIMPDPEKYEQDQETIYDPAEIDFIRDMEELGSILKESEESRGISEEELEEYDNTGFNAEQAYQEIKEKNREKELEQKELPLEEHDLQNTVEKAEEQHNENLKERECKEEDELPKEITDSEEFQYLWEEYDRLEQEGTNLEEISELMHEAEETYQMLKNYEEELEEIYERQEKQGLESIDHKNEEKPEDYRIEVESVYEAEYFIDAEIQLQTEGKSSEEITNEMQKVEEKYDFEEKVEKLHEKQRKDKYNSVDHENEEDEDDQREEIDRVDVIEGVVEAEEEFHKQGKSQKEIDEKTERIANKFYKNEIEEQLQNRPEQEVNKELGTEVTEPEFALEERDQINHTSFDNNDQKIEIYPEMENREILEEIDIEVDDSTNDRGSYQESMEKAIEKENKPETEESQEKEYELLQQLYHQDTGRRPQYRGRETKEYSQWLEHQKLKTKKAKEKEVKEQEEERWKEILKDWIEESKDEMPSSELKLVLKEIIQKFEILEELYREGVNLTEIERDHWLSKLIKLQNKYPIHLHLYQNIYGFKVYVQESHPWDINRIKNKFLRHLVKKYKILKQNLKNINFGNIKSSELRSIIKKYHKFTLNKYLKVKYPNRGFQITKQFFKWLKTDGNAAKMDKITNICKEINTNQELYNFFIYLVINSLLSLKKISEKFKFLGFNIHSSALGKYAKKILGAEYKIRFPSGKKRIQSFNNKNLCFHNLLNKVLLQKFYEFREEFPKSYPNTGRIIGDKFILWIKKNLKNFDEKRYLLKLIERVNGNREITQYIISLIYHSELTQLDIVNELWKKNLKISREAIRNIAEQNLSYDKYKERFSRYKKSYNYDEQLSSNSSLYQSLLNPVLHTSFKNYYQTIGKYANIGRKISNSFKSWIKRSKYKLNKRQRILNLIENINKNNEVERFIINIIRNSIDNSKERTSLGEISRMFKNFGLDVSRMTVTRIALEKVFNNDLEIFQKYFKPGQDEEFKDIDLQNLFFDDITNFGVVSKFKSFRRITREEGRELYPNIGTKISPYFIEWIKKNIKNDDEEKQKLIQLCEKIDEESQILQLILHRTLSSDLNISEIALEMENLGLNGQRGTISKNVLKYIYNNDKENLNLRFPSDLSSELGTWTHICIRDLLSKHFISINYKYYSEVQIFPPSNKKADGILLNIRQNRYLHEKLNLSKDGNRFKNKMGIKNNIIQKIKAIQFDFTSDISDENIIDKCIKYQNPNILLIIVCTNWKNKKANRSLPPLSNKVKNKDNLCIISAKLFTEFIGLNQTLKQEFLNIISKSNKSNLTFLKQYHKKNYPNLTNSGTIELKNDIGSKLFNRVFKDLEISEVNELIDTSKLASKFVSFCLENINSQSNQHELKSHIISKGGYKGGYFKFTTKNLYEFKKFVKTKNLNLNYLSKILANIHGIRNIFYKKILRYNSTLKRRTEQRVILIKKSFLESQIH